MEEKFGIFNDICMSIVYFILFYLNTIIHEVSSNMQDWGFHGCQYSSRGPFVSYHNIT
jgi:hypothetical protein